MEDFLERFPAIGQDIFGKLGNRKLTKCKRVSRSLYRFLEENKLIWVRMIDKYNANHIQFKVYWKSVMEKVPSANVKQLTIAIEKFYFMGRDQLEHQNSPHHIAAKSGSLSLCKFIIQTTRVLNPSRQDGMTGYHFAAQKGHFDVCKYFIDNLEDKNPSCTIGWTPLHKAAQGNHLAIYKLISKSVKDKNPKDTFGRTPLHEAAEMGFPTIVSYLMDVVADKNIKDDQGWAPIHLAVRNRHYDICKIIIECGGNPNPRNNLGISALDLVGKYKEIEDLIFNNLDQDQKTNALLKCPLCKAKLRTSDAYFQHLRRKQDFESFQSTT